MMSDAELHCPGPAAFTPQTLNSYSAFSVRLGTRCVKSGMDAVVGRVQLSSPALRFSTIYPVIGLPPSLRGFDQLSVIESTDESTQRGTPGGPGGSVKKSSKIHHESNEAENIKVRAVGISNLPNGWRALIGSSVIAGSLVPY